MLGAPIFFVQTVGVTIGILESVYGRSVPMRALGTTAGYCCERVFVRIWRYAWKACENPWKTSPSKIRAPWPLHG